MTFFSIFEKKSSLEKMDLGETKEGDFFFSKMRVFEGQATFFKQIQKKIYHCEMRVSFLRDAGHFFEKKSKKNSPVFLPATNKGDFLRVTFFLQKKKWP